MREICGRMRSVGGGEEGNGEGRGWEKYVKKERARLCAPIRQHNAPERIGDVCYF